jgi:hypothetical protein
VHFLQDDVPHRDGIFDRRLTRTTASGAKVSRTKKQLEAECEALQHALYFWLPCIPDERDGGPQVNQDCMDRIAKDAYLLAPMRGNCSMDTAESFGWVELRSDQPEG